MSHTCNHHYAPNILISTTTYMINPTTNISSPTISTTNLPTHTCTHHYAPNILQDNV